MMAIKYPLFSVMFYQAHQINTCSSCVKGLCEGARKRDDNKGEEMRGQGDREMEIELLGGKSLQLSRCQCWSLGKGPVGAEPWVFVGLPAVHTARSFPSILVGEYAWVWSFPVSA